MVEIVTRVEWGARAPKTTPNKITTPTPELWLHHSVSPSGFAARVRAIQNYHMDIRGWNDIAYSFLINHTGTIYEGRGPGVSGAHTAGHNTVSHAICLLGDFNTTQPTVEALASLTGLITHGFEEGWWPEGLTGGHRDTRGNLPKDCPGDILYSLIPEINEEATMPSAEEIALAVWNTKITRAGAPVAAIQELADIKTLLLAQSLDANHLTDAELDNAVNNLINALPQATLDLLKSKL